MSDGSFLGRYFSQPKQSIFHHDSIRRTFASGRFDPFGAYTASRRAIWGIIGLNAVVFGAWTYAINNRKGDLLKKLSQNFTLSIQNIREKRWWTLLTSAFSHQDPAHIAFNMISLHAFGTILTVAGIGAPRIIGLCLGSAVAGSGAFLYDLQYNSSDPAKKYRSGLGASGMVMGAAAASACLRPFAPMQLFFIPINIPLWVLTLVYAGVDTYFLHSNSPVGHAAHLGGSVFGAMYYFAYLRRFGGVWHMLGRRNWR